MRETIGVLLVDAGLAAGFVGLVSLARPLRFLRIPTRGAGGIVLAVGALLFAAGALLPARRQHSAGRGRIDAFLPDYQFSELHQIRVHAPADRVFRAIKTVTPDEIRLFRLLTWIRSPRLPGRGHPASLLAAPAGRPILQTATSSGFLLLTEDVDREIVLGTVVVAPRRSGIRTPEDFAALDAPGFARAVMNFVVEEETGGVSRVTTETRVFANDAAASRRFAVYWRLIYPGSAIIRRMWLQAVKERAEAGG